MKFMKLGLNPDTFYTEEATRTVISDVPTDLTIRIDGMSYLLHKSCLVPKCGLLQRLLSEQGDGAVELHDVPGGEEAFELCAKFCYGITINLSAHNFVPAFCAASFLRMTEKVENGNFIAKLEAFFSSCILQAWKDSLITLQSAERAYEWCENLGIVRRCIESIVDKILTPPTKVKWSYTYTRPGYVRKRRDSVPKDWWTEDLSCLGMDMWSSIVTTISSTNMLQPQLIGEALHVYAQCWLLDSSEGSRDSPNRKRRILETIVRLIPAEKGSVSIRFLLRLLSSANSLGASSVSKAELLKLSGLQLDEATLPDLLLPAQSPNAATSHDIDLVKMVARSFLRQWKRRNTAGESQSLRAMHKVGNLIDSYLQVVAKDARMPAQKMVSLIESIPATARPQQDHLYKAINIYLKEHPDVSKADKKHLCSFLDCQKLSPEVRSHAVKNERLPLRTVVQVLFFEQEKSNSTTDKKHTSSKQLENSVVRDDLSKLKVTSAAEEQGNGTRPKAHGTSGALHHSMRKLESKAQLSQEPSFKVKLEKETNEGPGDAAAPQLNPSNRAQMRSVSKMTHIKR
ncbi:BTB/POZ domain-containing protein At5g47800-like isoform X1 [Salvia hispanica]|uniref:BTB/POZ domain-containing protein At5g47800-like isoform X1 n=2 Tax=Salvia hispanica TaxID=49212 RepID=UPI00200969B2|nr:BTB/POZ domain-containing protein At5g47800-like isoform X1 [Salvia hispanica]XP_047945582.1 BTB/POZ domain-containing protein At5g47800-like isoform X1 [Salvia hispanica]XP_047945782.1 BTB/POZ domain-containing protein At5g47800-like isoform X1 [Salvia hispanica]XP_047945783.1 BTB/POZ domain-containing protein At5g47800-like isoform X1 [Salvia hispanica]